MATEKKREDRRIQRSHQLLQEGFVAVLREKGFAAMTIQDITDRANVNRGTFYKHFTDKYMLLDKIVRDNFNKMLANALPSMPEWNRKNLHILIRTVLDCFEVKYQHQAPSSRFPATLLEQTIHEELTKYLFKWIESDGSKELESVPQLEGKSRVISWAIFGPAIQWSQKPITIPVDQMANVILEVIMDGNE